MRVFPDGIHTDSESLGNGLVIETFPALGSGYWWRIVSMATWSRRADAKETACEAARLVSGMPSRPHHLNWDGEEWVDDRCGCRYHPDDDNGTHGGAPHLHLCAKHRAAQKAKQ